MSLFAHRDDQIGASLKVRTDAARPMVAMCLISSCTFSIAVQSIRALHMAAKGKRRIAADAAKVNSALLDGVGQVTWRAMWDAAREYSQTAYPQKEFPVTGKARCLLCHQELQPDAQQRLQDFETFVGMLSDGIEKAMQQAHSTSVLSSQLASRISSSALVWVEVQFPSTDLNLCP